jgi:hypothetical protein
VRGVGIDRPHPIRLSDMATTPTAADMSDAVTAGPLALYRARRLEEDEGSGDAHEPEQQRAQRFRRKPRRANARRGCGDRRHQ